MENIQATVAGALLSAFSGQSQQNRLLRLEFPLNDGPFAVLLANRLDAHEEVSRGYRFTVEVLSDDARIPLKVMMARMVTISLVRADGSLRYFNGYVTEFRLKRTDGGFAFYEMILEPWMAFTRRRKDNVSFHGKSVREITEATLMHYRQADWCMHTHDGDPCLTVANQHNETDFNHLHRRWEALGLHYWYEHRADGHTLMLSDSSQLAEPIDATRYDDAEVIHFHAESGSGEDDGIHAWSPVRQLGSGTMTLASFDYKSPTAQRASYESINAQGDFYPYEIYENTGEYGFRMRSDGETLAQKRMVEQDKMTQYFEAAGNDRTVQTGRVFKLGGHFSAEPRSMEHDPEPRASIGNREYLILDARHEASNNYQAGPCAPSHYKNTFTCIRSTVRWRPGRGYNSKPCANPGMQTAIVVGPAGSEIHTDSYGRVKIQFHWDRLGQYDENSSPWIRVMAPAAGNEFGQIRLPRVGEEVAVVFPDGNIDHPLILGAVYNGKNMPPWALPGQAPLSGLRSRELGGGPRGNHLLLDDTRGKIQAQLKSDHLCSQLSLGHIARIEDTAGRKDARGEGFELRTDGHGVARADKGMLITTEARPAARGPIKDMAESVRRLDAAHTLHDAQATAALRGLAQETDQQHAVADVLKAQYDAVRGTDSEFPEMAQPHLVLASPAGIATTTAQSTHITSSEHTALTTGRNLSIATGDSMFASIKQTFRLFVHKAGMKLVALHENFERAWSRAGGASQGALYVCTSPPSALLRKAAREHSSVQIVRTQPEESDFTIKDIYFNATRVAAAGTGYLYIENQYFQYKDWADHLLAVRKNVIAGWNRNCAKIGKTPEDLPMLYVFIVIPAPELTQMIPRTYDTLATLGQQEGMTGQVKLIKQANAEAELNARIAKQASFGDAVDRRAIPMVIAPALPAIQDANRIDKPTIEALEKTYGLRVCVAVLNSCECNAISRQWRYREIYIHSKLLLVNDSFFTLGSANLNQRSMVGDSEINVATNDPRQAGPLRQAIWWQLTDGKFDGGTCTPLELKNTHRDWRRLMTTNREKQKLKSIDPEKKTMTGFIVPLDDSRSSVLRLG